MTDWSKYLNFAEWEFRCKQTGRVKMQDSTLERLQLARYILQRPMNVNSGYRHISHPEERVKSRPGAHTFGHAADISGAGGEALELLYAALLVAAVEAKLLSLEEAQAWLPELLRHGFTGIGVQQATRVQHGNRFLHLDDIPGDVGRPRPWIWSY